MNVRMHSYEHTHLKLEKSPFAKGGCVCIHTNFKSSPKQASRCRIRMGEKKSMRSIHTNNKMGLMEKTCWFFVVDDNGGIPCEISLSSYFG